VQPIRDDERFVKNSASQRRQQRAIGAVAPASITCFPKNSLCPSLRSVLFNICDIQPNGLSQACGLVTADGQQM
jgi:hypothetical protein